jgi:3-hydroxybutyryl-CoA dehydrogenase
MENGIDKSLEIRSVGVVGAGVMGRGVAQNAAQSGFEVVLVDSVEAQLESAKEEIAQQIRFQKMFNKGKVTGDDNVLDRIQFTTELEELKDVSFLVENVIEKWEVKRPVYEEIDAICLESCVFAANTSAIPITKIASATNRADRVLGIHFMNPVPMKNTVEMIRGYHSSESTLDLAGRVLKKMGKNFVLVNDSPGFVSNRVLMLTVNEAMFLVHESVAEAKDVDKIFTSCFGHKMGPLETADLIGLDTILYSLDALYDSFQDPKFRPCPLLKQLVDAGQHGRKTGRGFFEYA